MISESERRKCEEEMREFMGGNIIIPDGVNLSSMGRKRIKIISKKELTKKRERVSIVSAVTRIIGSILRK